MDRPSYLESDAVRAAKSLGEGEDRWSTARGIRQAIAAGRILCASVFVTLYHRKYALVSTDTRLEMFREVPRYKITPKRTIILYE